MDLGRGQVQRQQLPPNSNPFNPDKSSRIVPSFAGCTKSILGMAALAKGGKHSFGRRFWNGSDVMLLHDVMKALPGSTHLSNFPLILIMQVSSREKERTF